jgi:hypothetical protein
VENTLRGEGERDWIRLEELNNEMIKFITFFEKRMRNPLRKKQLEDEGRMSNPEYIKSIENELPDEELKKIKKMEKAGLPQDMIDHFRNGKLALHKKKLQNDYLRAKIDKKKNIPILNKWGIQVFEDNFTDVDVSENSYNYRMINFALRYLVKDYKDILPNRKPKIIITDMKKNPMAVGTDIQGNSSTPAGLYQDRLIYIDQYHLDDPDILVHEYAHFVADRIPKQYEPLIRKEYNKMLQSYFERRTSRKNLEGAKNEQHREAMAQKLGLPSAYSTTNFDEFFAELIMSWKSLPNNTHTYRLKSMLKKILTRL